MSCIGAKEETFVQPGLVGDGRVGFEVGCRPEGAIDLVVDGEDSIDGPKTIDVSASSEPGGC